MQEKSHDKEKRGIFSSIFPREYDFEKMLSDQAEKTLEGVHTFIRWLEQDSLEEPRVLVQIEEEVDELRYEMEGKLVTSFSTPFDRQDIYSLSRQMDYILNYASETAREIYAFQVSPDPYVLDMAAALLDGTEQLVMGVKIMRQDSLKVEERIRRTRRALHRIDEIYINSMADLFQTEDTMNALKKREVYHHLRDAGRALRSAVDFLHRAVMGLT
jgi:uncharacterized protein Yka (UPF0111/DUF47 family)